MLTKTILSCFAGSIQDGKGCIESGKSRPEDSAAADSKEPLEQRQGEQQHVFGAGGLILEA